MSTKARAYDVCEHVAGRGRGRSYRALSFDGDEAITQAKVQSGDGALSWFLNLFLPDRYPESVTSEYLEYQLWDTTQATCSYVRGMLSQEAILRGLGIGSAKSTALAAVSAVIGRDFIAMASGILFTYTQGSNLDANAKQWRLVADMLNSVGLFLELLAPMSGRYFLAMACLGAVARSITGVAGSASRAAITQHFARHGNAADISAKEGSQETATTLLGMALGFAVLRLSSRVPSAPFALFAALSALHLVANVKAIRCLRFTTLNMYRMQLLAGQFMKDGLATPPHSPAGSVDGGEGEWQHVVAAGATRDAVASAGSLSLGSPSRERGQASGHSGSISGREGGCELSSRTAALYSPAVIGPQEPLLPPRLLAAWPMSGGARHGANIAVGASLLSQLSAPCGATRWPSVRDGNAAVCAAIAARGYGVFVRAGNLCALRLDVIVTDSASDVARARAVASACMWNIAASRQWRVALGPRNASVAEILREAQAVRGWHGATHAADAGRSSAAAVLLPDLCDSAAPVRMSDGHSQWRRADAAALLRVARAHGWALAPLAIRIRTFVSLSPVTDKEE